MEYYARWYVYPYFHQTWTLFVPAPTTNYHLYAEWEDNGTQRTDLFGEILLKHQTNRLKGYGPLVIAFTNSIHYFEKNTTQQAALNGPVTNNTYFKMIENSALNYLRHSRNNARIDSIKLKLVVESVDSGALRTYFN